MKSIKEEISQSIATKQAILDNEEILAKIAKAAEIMTDAALHQRRPQIHRHGKPVV